MLLRRVCHLEEPSKHVRLDAVTSAELSEKLRRESADSGTSSSEVVTRVESPLCGKSESDSGRPETPNENKTHLNPFSVSALMASSSSSKTPANKSPYKAPQAANLPASAFSNPSLHSAAVHHRNLQAAAAANLQANFSHLIPNLLANSNLAHQLAALQQQGASQTPFQPLINPLFNPLLSQYSPLFQQRTSPLGKTVAHLINNTHNGHFSIAGNSGETV